jgi:hypothetical protein
MFKIDFTDLSYDPKWYDFADASGGMVEGVRLRVRPYPLSMASFTVKDDGLVFSQAEQCRMFKHALVGWEGVVGADGQPLPCTDEVKQKIFDFGLAPELVEFVMAKAREFREVKAQVEKNS